MKNYERKDKRSKILKVLHFPFIYVFCFMFGIFVFILRLLGRVKIEFPEQFPKWKNRLIIASNHPSAFEPWLLLGIFFSECVLHPIMHIPYITPDKKLFKRWFLYPIWDRMIFIPRGNIRGELKAFFLISLTLRRNRRVIIFPEGGRTGRGKEKEIVYSKKGKPLRSLKNGIGIVALHSGATIIPVWISGADKVLPIGALFPRLWIKVIIRWGEPIQVFQVGRKKRKELVQPLILKLQNALLELADK